MSSEHLLINKFSSLPIDIVNYILKYLNIISYRIGKYIDKINENDLRYSMLRKIPRPIKISNNQYYIGLRFRPRNVIKTSLTYVIQEDHLMITISENYIGRNGLKYSTKFQDVVLR